MKNLKISLVALFAFSALFATAQTQVAPGQGTLDVAIAAAENGAVLELTDGEYATLKLNRVSKDLTIRAAKGTNPVLISNRKSVTNYIFCIENSANITLEGLTFDGKAYAEDKKPGTYAFIIKNSKDHEVSQGIINVKNCTFRNFTSNGTASIKFYPNTLINELNITDSKFINNTAGVQATMRVERQETDTHYYCVEKINISNTLFDNLTAYAINFMANSEKSSDISLIVDHCVFNECGKQNIVTRRVRHLNVNNSIFVSNDNKKVAFRMQAKTHTANNCCIHGTRYTEHGGGKATNIIDDDPRFENGTFTLSRKSPLKGKATDGSNIGLK